MSKYMNQKYAELTAYTPGEQPLGVKYIKLNTNESPYPPSPDVLVSIGYGELSDLRLYSDPDCRGLRKALGEFYSRETDEVFVSNGSDDILNFAFMAFSENGVVFPDITYGFYEVYAKLHGANYEKKPLCDDFTIKTEDYLDENGKLIVIANPNAPTGKALPLSDIERIVASNPDRVIVVDEAYVDFGGESAIPLTKKYDNLLVCATYSKSRGMAGARLGFAIGKAELIADLELMKYSTNPYNLDSLALRMGAAALTESSKAYYEEKVGKVIRVREETAKALVALGATVLPSKANFLFVKLPNISGGDAYKRLRECGILVRHFSKERISDYLRISIGTAEEMDTLVKEVEKIIEV